MVSVLDRNEVDTFTLVFETNKPLPAEPLAALLGLVEEIGQKHFGADARLVIERVEMGSFRFDLSFMNCARATVAIAFAAFMLDLIHQLTGGSSHGIDSFSAEAREIAIMQGLRDGSVEALTVRGPDGQLRTISVASREDQSSADRRQMGQRLASSSAEKMQTLGPNDRVTNVPEFERMVETTWLKKAADQGSYITVSGVITKNGEDLVLLTRNKNALVLRRVEKFRERFQVDGDVVTFLGNIYVQSDGTLALRVSTVATH